MRVQMRFWNGLTILALLVSGLAPLGGSAAAVPVSAPTVCGSLFFSEYVEGSSFNKAIEIYNGTPGPVDLTTVTVEIYWNGEITPTLSYTPAAGTLASDDVFVMANSSASDPVLSASDLISDTLFFNGDDALVLKVNGVVVDRFGQVGFNPTNEWGSGLVSSRNNTLRRMASVSVGDPNATAVFDPALEWDGYPLDTFDGLGAHTATCYEPEFPPSVLSTTPSHQATAVAVNSDITINFSEPVGVTDPWFTISCTTSGVHTAAVSGGPTTFTLNPGTDFAEGETCTVTVIAAGVDDVDPFDPPGNPAADYIFTFTTILELTIHEIQGAAHLSAYDGQKVYNVPGIVTALAARGFYMQDPNPDADPATSEGIFVFTFSAPTVQVGDSVSVTATVDEFYPGGYTSGNLPITELVSATIVVLSSGNPLPAPVVIGTGGRIPPAMVIEDDASNVETEGVFDPATDGIDFYESLEAMRVQVNNALAVGPTNAFGELAVVGDGGENASGLTPRGGIVIQPDDFNPERIILDDELLPVGQYRTGDRFVEPIVGVVTYSFGNFKLTPTQPLPAIITSTIEAEITFISPNSYQLRVATFNVENLDPSDTEQAAMLGDIIANNLKAPDIIGLQEIQDNTGAADDGVSAADQTYQLLIDEIAAAGGPAYEFQQIDPVDNQDGGAPGANIRVGFLYRPDQVTFVERGACGATDATAVVSTAGEPQLTCSPGRVDPANTAWFESRKPLAGEFIFNGQTVFIVVNHFASKSGDGPLFGRYQPPILTSEAQRIQQAEVVNAFVDEILAVDPDAAVVVLGDLNDFYFSPPIQALKGTPEVLHDLILDLPVNERYTYIYDGNSEDLDHILVSQIISTTLEPVVDIVHVNAEFPRSQRASDHDPVLAAFTLVPFGEADFTDLTPSYDVAWHTIISENITLGEDVDADFTFELNADNFTDTGINPVGPWADGAGGATVEVTIAGTGTGCLAGWFDWDQNGIFEADENSMAAHGVTPGTHPVSMTVPTGTFTTTLGTPNLFLAARFRLYSGACPASPTFAGAADGGEVEDYLWEFTPTGFAILHKMLFPILMGGQAPAAVIPLQ